MSGLAIRLSFALHAVPVRQAQIGMELRVIPGGRTDADIQQSALIVDDSGQLIKREMRPDIAPFVEHAGCPSVNQIAAGRNEVADRCQLVIR